MVFHRTGITSALVFQIYMVMAESTSKYGTKQQTCVAVVSPSRQTILVTKLFKRKLYFHIYFHRVQNAHGLSGFGFELTFRLKKEPGQMIQPSWPAELMQELAKYVFRTSE